MPPRCSDRAGRVKAAHDTISAVGDFSLAPSWLGTIRSCQSNLNLWPATRGGCDALPEALLSSQQKDDRVRASSINNKRRLIGFIRLPVEIKLVDYAGRDSLVVLT